MNNIVSYAKEHMESFDVRPLNRVDSLILSELSYFQLPQELSKARGWRGVRLAELFRAECFEQMFDGVWDGESCRQLLTALSASPRFRDIHVMGYREQSNVADEKQFAAVTFRLSWDGRNAGRLERGFQHGVPVSCAVAGSGSCLSERGGVSLPWKASCRRPLKRW